METQREKAFLLTQMTVYYDANPMKMRQTSGNYAVATMAPTWRAHLAEKHSASAPATLQSLGASSAAERCARELAQLPPACTG